MSFALRWDDETGGGFIYLDAVTAYSQSYRGKATAHPIDAGGNITDHFIKNNPAFRLSAVISGVDISTGIFMIEDLQGNSPYNAIPAPSAVSVNSTDQSVLQKLIPDSIGQFLSDQTPEILIDERRTDLTRQIQDALISLTSGQIVNQETGQYLPQIKILELYEYDNIKLTKVINRLVMTEVTFREAPESGFALFCDFSFEQVTFTTLKKTTIPQEVTKPLSKKASPKNSKGRQDSTPKDVADGEGPKDVDPLREAQTN